MTTMKKTERTAATTHRLKGALLLIGSDPSCTHLDVGANPTIGRHETLCESVRGVPWLRQDDHGRYSDRSLISDAERGGHGIVTCKECLAAYDYPPVPGQEERSPFETRSSRSADRCVGRGGYTKTMGTRSAKRLWHPGGVARGAARA